MVLNSRAFFLYFFSGDCGPFSLITLAAKGETIVNRVYHLDRGFLGLRRKISTMWGKNSTVNGVTL
ncbi:MULTISPECIES: UDP-N-acetylglucosamine 1-carboxyvinyltransferase [Bartonella]|uniref:UDP-N-acetylglucosamine 1-carboxyvinyltransferase n=1 Tax=Bartonella TaxID=773 RepID=UPI002362AB9C|nr:MULTISPECIES: UDP-N-acetylglucosamine 1-carboxyvinyltransferase [Bartonella]